MSAETTWTRRQLRREVRTALELAIAALAPPPVIDGLAAASGLLEALEDLPPDVPPVRALEGSITGRAQSALAAWRKWQATRGLGDV